jgi:hypothetical protein
VRIAIFTVCSSRTARSRGRSVPGVCRCILCGWQH